MFSAALQAQASEPDGSHWLRIVGDGLAGRRLVVEEGGTHSTAYILGGADSSIDGIWIPLTKAPLNPPELTIHPPLETPIDTQALTVPDELGEGWVIIPLPLSAWGVASVGELDQIRVSERHGRWSSSSAVRRTDGPTVCPSSTVKRIEPTFDLPLVVADFEGGLTEPLGNRYAAFEGRGASVETTRVRRGGATSLRISATFPKHGGFGGVWFHLGPPDRLTGEESGIDLREADAVVVRGRGQARGKLAISDVAANKRGGAVEIGPLPSGQEREWTTVLPLDRRKLDLSRLRSVVIDLTGSGSGILDIDEILIVGDRETVPPPRRRSMSDTDLDRRAGIWIWNTRDFFAPRSPQRLRLARMIGSWKLTEAYLQIPHDSRAETLEKWAAVDEAGDVAELVAWLHQNGIDVHALDGAPYLALPEARTELMEIAGGVAEYNCQVPTESRFDALHMDIEPYLLPVWSGPRRAEVLRNLGESIPMMREHAGVPVWLDIPFWFDAEREERSPERGDRAGCARRDLLEALFRNADGVGIMAYRTKADGPGGIASAAMTEARLAKEYERPFMVGIETIDLDEESGWVLRPGHDADPKTADPLAVLVLDGSPVDRYLLFTEQATEADLEALRENEDRFRLIAVERREQVPPDLITFWGRPANDIREQSEEAIRLLRRSGFRADGIAYHEMRTLPLD